MIKEKLVREEREFTLRFSNIGAPCVRKLWLEKNFPEKKIPLTYDSLMKFQFGDLTEEYLLFLAELAGHKVEYRQEEVKINGIKGHWDAIIDGVLIDCKSASSYSFKKFKEGLTPETDAFGYLTQIGSYHYAAVSSGYDVDPSVAGFLVFDKQHGHICLDLHDMYPDDRWEKLFEERKQTLDSDQLPERHYSPIPEGKSGNEILPINCSYCDMKHACYDNLRTFLYSTGPKYFTKVVKEPMVNEVK